MRIRLLSDLHLEGRDFTYVDRGEDLTVLAGDICTAVSTGRMANFLRRIPHPVVYVPGNHEYYRGYGTRSDQLGRLRLFASGFPGVTLLDNEHFDFRGYRFLGSTLWTDFRLPHVRMTRQQIMEGVPQAINDFRQVVADDGKGHAMAEDMERWSLASQAYLEGAIAASPLPVAVVTHFLPSPLSVHARFKGEALNTYFVCDVSRLIRSPVVLWMHGHTHDAFDYMHQGVRVVCNPRGYLGEASGYDANLIIELPEAR
jgi:predicted phosphodiesterase